MKLLRFPLIGIALCAAFFIANTEQVHAAASLSCAKYANTSAYTVYATFGAMPVYRIAVNNTGDATGSVTAVAPTPSGSADDTSVTMSFFEDADNSGTVTYGDTDLGGSAAFSTDNTQKTFTFSSSVSVPAGQTKYILALANGSGSPSNTFSLTINATDVTVTGSCGDGGMGSNTNSLTLSSTVPNIKMSQGSSTPSSANVGNSDTTAEIHQVKFVNLATTNDVINSITLTPFGTVAEGTDSIVRLYIDGGSTAGTVDGSDTRLMLQSAAWAGDSNSATTFTIKGGGLQIGASTTVNLLIVQAFMGSASDGETHYHTVGSTDIVEASGINLTMGSGQSDPLTSATLTIDATAPTISNVYFLDTDNDGKIDAADIIFSESVLDSTITVGNWELDTDALNDGDVSEVTAESTSTTTTAPSGTDADADDDRFRISITTDGSELSGTGQTNGAGGYYAHYAAGTLTDSVGNSLAGCAACGTENDFAQPILSSAVKSNSSGKNIVTLTFSEDIFIDNSNQDGTLDAADTTNAESLTSTASVGGIDAAGSIEQMGNFATAGNYTQSAETCNTLAVSGPTITITINSVSGCYFTAGSTASSGIFTLDNNNYIYASNGSGTSKTLNASALTASSSGSWDTTAPGHASIGSSAQAGGDVTVYWTAISDPGDFNRYAIYYGTSTGVTAANGTLWGTSNDAALSTRTTASTIVTGLTFGTTYYFIVYAIDDEGNLSTASSEATATPTGTQSKSTDTTAPGLPQNITITQSLKGDVTLTWEDPTDSDLASIEIYRGVTVSGTFYKTITKGVQKLTDSELKNGDIVSYHLKSKDATGNASELTEEISITVIVDAKAPELDSIEAKHSQEIVITFSETLKSVTKEALKITDENKKTLAVESISADGKIVTVTTAPQKFNKKYTVTVTGVKDEAGNQVVKGTKDSGTFTGAAAAKFQDVNLSEHGWAMEQIEWARTNGHIIGREKEKFAPGSKVVRSELAGIMAKAIGSGDIDTDGTAKFLDTYADIWYTPYINFLYEKNITRGRALNYFVPQAFASRSEVIAMIVRWMETSETLKPKIEEISVNAGLGTWGNPYADVTEGQWYTRTTAIATHYKILQGKDSDGKKYASPGAKITRAEAIVMLKRAYDIIKAPSIE